MALNNLGFGFHFYTTGTSRVIQDLREIRQLFSQIDRQVNAFSRTTTQQLNPIATTINKVNVGINQTAAAINKVKQQSPGIASINKSFDDLGKQFTTKLPAALVTFGNKSAITFQKIALESQKSANFVKNQYGNSFSSQILQRMYTGFGSLFNSLVPLSKKFFDKFKQQADNAGNSAAQSLQKSVSGMSFKSGLQSIFNAFNSGFKSTSQEAKKLGDHISHSYRYGALWGGRFFAYAHQKFGALGFVARGFTGILVGGFQNALKVFTDFESQAMSAFTLVSDQSVEAIGGFEGMMQGMKDLAFKYGQNLQDIATGFKEALGSGVDPRYVQKFMDITAKLAVGGKTTADVAQRGILMLANSYQIAYNETEKLNEISDALFAGFNFGVTTINDLSKNVYKLAPIAKTAGLTMGEVIGIGAGLTTEGRTTRFAFMEAARMVDNFLNPAKEYGERMKQIGIVSGQTAFTINGGLIPTLLKANEAIKSSGAIPQDIFQQTNARRAFTTYSQGFDKINLTSQRFYKMIEQNKTFELLAQRLGKTGDEAKQFLGTVFGAMQIGGQKGAEQLDIIAKSYGTTVEELRQSFAGTTADFIVQNKEMGGAAMALFRQLYHPIEGMAAQSGSVTEDAFKKMTTTLDFQFKQLKSSAQIFGADFIGSIKPILTFLSAVGSTVLTVVNTIQRGFKLVFGNIGEGLGNVTVRLQKFQERLKGIFTPVEVNLDSQAYKDFLNLPIAERMQFVRGSTNDMVKAFAVSQAETNGLSDKFRNLIFNLQSARDIYVSYKDALSSGDIAKQQEMLSKMDVNPLVKVFGFLMEKVESVKKAFSELWAGFSQSPQFKQAIAAISGIATILITIFSSTLKIVLTVASAIGVSFGGIGEAGKTGMEKAGAGIAGFFASFLPLIQTALGLIKTVFSSLVSVITSIISRLLPAIAPIITIASNIASTIIKLIQSILPPIINVATILIGVVSNIITALTPVINSVAQVISDIIPYISSFITEFSNAIGETLFVVGGAIQSIITTLTPIIQAAFSIIKPILAIAIPIFSGIIKFGMAIQNVFISITQGIIGLLQPLIDLVSWILTSIFGSTENGAISLGGTIANVFNFMVDAINNVALAFRMLPAAAGEAFSAIVAAVQYVGEAIVGAFKSAFNWVIDQFSFVLEPIMGILNTIGITAGTVSDLKLTEYEGKSFDELKSGIESSLGIKTVGQAYEAEQQTRRETTAAQSAQNAASVLSAVMGGGNKPSLFGEINLGDLMGGLKGGMAMENVGAKVFEFPTGAPKGQFMMPDEMADMMQGGMMDNLSMQQDQNDFLGEMSNSMNLNNGLMRDQTEIGKAGVEERKETGIGKVYEDMAAEKAATPEERKQERMTFNINLKDDDGIEKRARIEAKRDVDKQFRNWYREVKVS